MAKQFQVDTGGTLTTSLVSYYKFEGLADFYGSNTLTGVGSPTFTSGKVGNALTLDGSTQYVTSPHRLAYADFSISFSFKSSDVTVLQSIFQERNTTDGNPIVAVFIFGSALYFRLRGNSGTGLTTTAGKAISSNTYYNVTVKYTKSSNAMSLRINNGTADTATYTGGDFSNLNSCTWGAEAFSFSEKLNGQIDEGGIWSKVLSTTEESDLNNGGSAQTMVHAQALTDTSTTTDSVLKQGQKVLTQNPTITDSILKQASRILTQTITSADTALKSTIRTLTDTATIGNVLTTLKIITANMTLEAVTLTGNFLRSMVRTLSENPTIADTIRKSTSRLFSDSVTALDSVLKLPGKLLSDGFTVADSFLRSLVRTLSETATLVDVHVKQVGRSLTQTLTLTATFTRGLTYVRTLVESLTIVQAIKEYLNNLNSRYNEKHPARGTTYTSKYSRRNTEYDQKYPSP